MPFDPYDTAPQRAELELKLAGYGGPKPTEYNNPYFIPTLSAGMPDAKIWGVPGFDTNYGALGAVIQRPYDRQANKEDPKFLYVDAGIDNQDETEFNPRDVLAHESEHLRAKHALGHAKDINSKFDELVGDASTRKYLALNLPKLREHLIKNYGLSQRDAYFSKDYVFSHENPRDLLYEQLASLSALESRTGKRLMNDPEVRKIFKTSAMRESYDAVTGLRQNRLDARDLPTYTRIPENPTQAAQAPVERKVTDTPVFMQMGSLLDRIKAKIGIK